MFNTASKRGAKMCPFYSGNCTKITKTKTQKNPKSFSSNRYCLFTSQQNSLHLAACMKHFSTPDNIESTRLLFFFFELLYGCVEVVFFFFLSFFLWCSMLKAEKQAIICTLYTQHTPLQPFPTPPPLSASYQNIRT